MNSQDACMQHRRNFLIGGAAIGATAAFGAATLAARAAKAVQLPQVFFERDGKVMRFDDVGVFGVEWCESDDNLHVSLITGDQRIYLPAGEFWQMEGGRVTWPREKCTQHPLASF